MSVGGTATASHVSITPLDSEPRLLLSGAARYSSPAISRDGNWLAYTSTESGRAEVYVRPVEDGGRHQISLDGGGSPRWSFDGRTLYYRADRTVFAARLVFAPEFVVSRRDSLCGDAFGVRRALPFSDYDVSPSSTTQFLMIGHARQPVRAVAVLNWLDELRERAALAAKK